MSIEQEQAESGVSSVRQAWRWLVPESIRHLFWQARHPVALFKRWSWGLLERYYSSRAPRRIHQLFDGSTFIGPYEKSGHYASIWMEQWLWQRKELIRGIVLDMSTPRHWHEQFYQLPAVEKVLISDLSEAEVEKYGQRSTVDIVGDFGAEPMPSPPDSYDTIFCLSILEHCADPQQMLTNLGRLIRPQGTIFVWCPFAYPDGHMEPDYWRFCRDGYRLLARKAGLEILEEGQYEDLGRFYRFLIGRNLAIPFSLRGVPIANWMICRRSGTR